MKANIGMSALQRHPHHQGGASLIMVMIVLTIVSIIGVAGIQISLMSERGARNDRDQQIAWQAAEAGLKKLRSKLILWIMYRFFRTFTKLPARKLIQPDPFLQAAGFGLVQGVQSEWGLLRSDWWQRTSTITPQPES